MIFFLLAILVLVLSITVVSPLLLRPLSQTRQSPGSRIKFTLVDLFSLMVQSALFLGAITMLTRTGKGSLAPIFSREPGLLLMFFSCLLVVLAFWLQGIRQLSFSQVNKSLQRFVYLSFVVPTAYIVPLALCIAVLLIFNSSQATLQALSLTGVLSVMLCAVASLSLWVYNTGRTDEEPESSEQGE